VYVVPIAATDAATRETYEHQPAFQFIRDVGSTGITTRVIAARLGLRLVAAARAHGPSWYVGAITDEEARTFDVPSFLMPGRKYVAEDLRGRAGANWLTNPRR